jgi:histone deacetylase 1/2
MTSFHTDEYIHFLSRVTPDTAEELTYNGTRCELYVNHGLSR